MVSSSKPRQEPQVLQSADWDADVTQDTLGCFEPGQTHQNMWCMLRRANEKGPGQWNPQLNYCSSWWTSLWPLSGGRWEGGVAWREQSRASKVDKSREIIKEMVKRYQGNRYKWIRKGNRLGGGIEALAAKSQNEEEANEMQIICNLSGWKRGSV